MTAQALLVVAGEVYRHVRHPGRRFRAVTPIHGGDGWRCLDVRRTHGQWQQSGGFHAFRTEDLRT